MPLHAGQLDQRITLQRPVTTKDALGQRVQAWADVATVWAQARPTPGREFTAAGAQQNAAAVVFAIRWRADVQSTWRAVWRGVPYALVADPIDPLGARTAIELVCKSGAAAA